MLLNKAVIIAGVFFTMLVASMTVSGQSKADEAKNYLYAAEYAYEEKDYAAALGALNKVEEIMGKSGATLAALRVKIYADQKQWLKAKQALSTFYNFSPSAKYARKMSPFLLKIDAGLKVLVLENEARRVAQTQRDIEAAKYAERQRLIQIENDEKEALLAEKKRLAQVQQQQWLDEVDAQCVSAEKCYAFSIVINSEYKKSYSRKSSVQRYASKERSCELNVAAACFEFSDVYFSKHTIDQKFKNILKRACDLNHAEACGEVAYYAHKKNRLALYKKSCNLGYARACNQAALHYAYGADSQKHLRQDWRIKGCNLGTTVYCSMVGNDYWFGHDGVKKNKKKARYYLSIHCDATNGKDKINCKKRARWKKKN